MQYRRSGTLRAGWLDPHERSRRFCPPNRIPFDREPLAAGRAPHTLRVPYRRFAGATAATKSTPSALASTVMCLTLNGHAERAPAVDREREE
jgi:hypothetical protein